MTQQIIIDNEFLTMWYYPDTKIVHHKFHRFIYGERLREALLTGTAILKKNKASKWLSDDRENAALPKEDHQWGETVWFPSTVEAGWKFWAIILPEKIIGQVNMSRQVKTYAEMGIITQIFSDSEKARLWLEQQK